MLEYTNERENKNYDAGAPPDGHSFYTDAYTLDSLTSMTKYTDRIGELKAEKQASKSK